MKSQLESVLIALILGLSVQQAIASTTIVGSLPSDSFSGQIDSQNENGFSAIFTVNTPITGTMLIDVDPIDVGKKMPLYLVAKWNENWYVRSKSGNWQSWNQQLKDLVPYTSRFLKSQEILDLPLELANKKGEYTLFAGYLNSAQQIVFNKKPLAFTLLDESKLGLHQFSSAAMMEQFLKDGIKANSSLMTQFQVFDGAEFTAALASTDTVARSFSTTNIQETGVEEADRIKTDGTHLYVLGDCNNQQQAELIEAEIAPINITANNTCILSYKLAADTAEATKIGKTDLNSDHYFNRLYLADSQAEEQTDLLVAIGQSNNGFNIWYNPWNWQSQTTEIHWLNVEDIAAPIKAHHIQLDGSLISSRRIDRVLYVVTRFTPAIQNYNQYPSNDDEETLNEQLLQQTNLFDLTPKISYKQEALNQLVDAENCFMSPIAQDVMPDPSIITITAISLDNPKQTNSTCIVGSSETLYMSQKSLYLATTKYHYPRILIDQDATSEDNSIFDLDHTTELHKFSIDGINVAYKGSGEVTGHLGWHEDKKPFRMSEYNDVLRIATSVGDNWLDTSSTSLWTLKETENTEQLEVVGHLADLGKPGEQLYASRFIGDRGYLVTFLLTDPLYVLDLSDPTSPSVLGELEIEGYSDYLHPIDENYILGIGKDAIADTQSSDRLGRGAWYQGLKLSLFDVSDPRQPSEVNSIILGKRGTESDVLYDHHALAYLPPNELRGARLAIPVRLHENIPAFSESDLALPSTWYDPTHIGLYLFDINVTGEIGIEQQGKIISQQVQASNPMSDFLINNFGRTDRAVLQDDNVYYIHGTDVISRKWLDF